MTQRAYPIADLFDTSNGVYPNGWYEGDTGLGGTGTMFQHIDDQPGFDTSSGNYLAVRGVATLNQDHVYVTKLGPLEKPSSRGNHIIYLIWNYLADVSFTHNGQCVIEIRQDYVDEANKGKLIYILRASDSPFDDAAIPEVESSATIFAIPEGPGTSVTTGLGYLGAVGITNYKNLSIRFAYKQAVSSGLQLWMVHLTIPRKELLISTVRSRGPTDAIYGEVHIFGDVNGPPVCQLINPTTSPVKLRIWELWIWGGGDNGNIGSEGRQALNAIRRTSDPFAVGAGASSHVYANQIHLDQNLVGTIHGVLHAFSFWNAQFHGPDAPNGNGWLEFEYPARWGIDCQWMLRPSAPSALDVRTVIRPKGGFPWCVMPGSALEAIWMSTGNTLRLGVVYDQQLLD